jgi:molybdopterin guanine dinucleotide-containing S/N-oxide reductase-like protein
VPSKQDKVKVREAERTFIKALGLGGMGGIPCAVDVKDGKVVRIRPLHFDWKWDRKDINPWKIEVRGKLIEACMKSQPGPFSLAYKKRVYSPNRIKYPLKRIDWDPNGERHPENRGKSKYKRISWDEAAEIIASEIKRVQKQYGRFAILTQNDGHSEGKTVHAPHGCPSLLLSKTEGFTQQVRNPDSWEGWYWGAKHVWGEGWVGLMDPGENLVKDMSEHSELLLWWGGDPETTQWGMTGQSVTLLCYFWSEIGIKQVFICPELNYAAAVHADKWIPILPNTDAALQLAIIYTWITEGTYDKEYVATHTVGMDKIEAYVMGKEDGVPKTPEWASPKCGIPEWTIKALAREFGSKTTSIAHGGGGGMIRGPYSHEPCRFECILLGMQGLGKPGVHQYWTGTGKPRSNAPSPAARLPIGKDAPPPQVGPVDEPIRLPGLFGRFTTQCNSKQFIPKTLIQEAILNPPISFWGTGAIMEHVTGQFIKYTYPISKEEGGTEVHMIWTDNPCRTTCWNDGNRTMEAMRSPKIECIVAQHQWLENDCLAADIILPVSTTIELNDITTNSRFGEDIQSAGLQRQAINHIGESKSDYEIILEVAKKLGIYDEVSEGRSIEEWIRYIFEVHYNFAKYTTWEEFEEKNYYCYPIASDWENDPPGKRKFYEDPENNPLDTPSGKLEFYSERLAKHFPDDTERPPMPKWIEKGETHDERISGERAKKYPLLMMSNHPKWRMHAQCDDISWTREALTCKVKAFDGYMYEPLWINPATAAERGIKNRDIVKAYNERGTVLCGAYVTERIMPGVVYVDHGARVDWIIPGELDRGGAINLISPTAVTSKHCLGQATSGYLVEVEKVTMAQMEEWRTKCPEAFEKEYDPASGLRFNAWIEGGI